MSKHSGLSQLADAATEMISPAFAHYPVRRKGERRRLNPNTDGIAWLEGEDFLSRTEIVEEGAPLDGLRTYIARGWFAAKRGGNFARPMFQVFGMVMSSSATMAYTPCPDCDDWSRTSKCGTHHDLDGIAGLWKGSVRGDRTPQAPSRLQAATIEVNGETLQGVVSFSIEIEGGSRGQETVTYYF